MKRFLLFISITLFLFCLSRKGAAQGNQTVVNGAPTAAITLPAGCAYNWVNDTPSIGLPAAGDGDIPSFIAVNTGNSPVTATITVTPFPGGYAYIANSAANQITVLNTATGLPTAIVNVGSSPQGVVVSPDGSKVFVCNAGSNSVSVINTADNSVISIPVGSLPGGIAISPDGKWVYVTNNLSGSVSVINTVTNAVATIPVGTEPDGIAVNPDGSLVYVANYLSASVSVISTSGNLVINTIQAGNDPQGIALSPDGAWLYVTNASSNTVSVISTASGAITNTIAVGGDPAGIAVSSDGSKIYVANFSSNTVSVISTSSNTVIATIPVGQDPFGLSLTSDGSRLYVENTNGYNISMINTATNTQVEIIGAVSGPLSMGNFITKGTGCTGAPVTFTITVNPGDQNIKIPNAFTPNGDGINDTWAIKNLSATYPNCTVAIFTRWGQNVYSSIGYPVPWNGTYRGRMLPMGTYYYIINLKNGLKSLAGPVTIIR